MMDDERKKEEKKEREKERKRERNRERKKERKERKKERKEDEKKRLENKERKRMIERKRASASYCLHYQTSVFALENDIRARQSLDERKPFDSSMNTYCGGGHGLGKGTEEERGCLCCRSVDRWRACRHAR